METATIAPRRPPPSLKTIKHDIFLSHSGQQKGFARDLDARLSSLGYTVFFDQNDDCLPLGEEFPPHIFSAVNSCKLAIVVISEDFVTSRWPLMELCSFVDRLHSQSPDVPSHSFTILPLFLKLSSSAIKAKENIEKWRIEWARFERQRCRISAENCEHAVTKVLPRLSGVERNLESWQGEGSYIDGIITRILNTFPPRNLILHRYGANCHKRYVGLERLSQLILGKFRELEVLHSNSESEGIFTNGCILGMYGVSGSGKSTLCNTLCNSMFDEFTGKVIHLELPTESRGDGRRIKEQYGKLLSTICPHTKAMLASMDLVQLYNMLLTIGARFNHKMFLVLDNISPSNYGSYETMVNAILSSAVLGSGSRVMLVSQSSAILESILKEVKHRYTITEVPCFTTEEAKEIIRNCYPLKKEDVITHLLERCSFRSSSFMYVPFIFEQIGILMREKRWNDVNELELLWKMVDEGKKNAIHKLVEINFKQLQDDLRILFFDIALFIIPGGYSKLTDATPILCCMHGINDTFKLEWKIMDLQKHCALSVTGEELKVHDIFTEYARNVPGNSTSYANMGILDISDTAGRKRYAQNGGHTLYQKRMQLDFSEARIINFNIATCSKSADHHTDDIDEEALLYHQKVYLQVKVGATTRALFVRNSAFSKCILGLSGDLSHLLCLQMKNVQQIAFSPSGSDVDLSKVLRLEFKNERIGRDIRLKTCSGQKRKRMSNILDFIGHQFQNSTQSMKWLLKPLLSYEKWPASYDNLVSNFVLSGRMTQLRALMLCNAQIRRLKNIGIYCPHLEVLEVLDGEQNLQDVTVDSAVKLERLVFWADRSVCRPWHYCASSGIYDQHFTKLKPMNSRKLVLYLGQCPQLQEIRVDGSFDQVKVVGLLPCSLRHAALSSDRCLQFWPSKLISSSIHRLSLLETLKLRCKKVESLHFTRENLGGLPSLKELVLESCDNLTHLFVGPGCMPNLVSLCMSFCDKLQAFDGIHHILEQLKDLELWYLAHLQLECDVGKCSSREADASLQLQTIDVHRCPGVKMNLNVIEASKDIRRMQFEGVSICMTRMQNSDSNCVFTPSTKEALDRFTVLDRRFTFLWHLELSHVDHLREIEGIEHLTNLQDLSLRNLPDLGRVSRTWPTRIHSLNFHDCSMLEAIPPLEQTSNLCHLWYFRCARLKGVEGSFGEMKCLTSIRFRECERMEAFPMEDRDDVMVELGKKYEDPEKLRWVPVSVYGSKFASVEAMKRWLQDAEMGSPLWKAAVEALMWEHVEKGTMGAMDALLDHYLAHGGCSSQLHLNSPRDEDLQDFCTTFSSCHRKTIIYWNDSGVDYKRKPELKLFEAWLSTT